MKQVRVVLEALHQHSVTSGFALFRSSILIVIVFLVGTFGYWFLSGPKYTLFDAFYMTAITLTTVGYGEVIDLTHNTGGRVFTILLLFTGVGSFVHFFSKLMTFAIEGSLDRFYAERKMRTTIEKLDDHFIVCGSGFVGRQIIRELQSTQRTFVLIERELENIHTALDEVDTGKFPYVLGDATDDEVLHEAGIERASGIVICMTNDKDNLITTFSARLLNSDVRIVTRSSDPKVEKKLYKAGADAVVSLNLIGGLRMVSEMVRPTAVSFLDTMLRDRDQALRVEEILIEHGSSIAGSFLCDLRHQMIDDLLVVALHKQDGEWLYNPKGDSSLEAGTSVVFISDVAVRNQLEQLAKNNK